MKRTDLFYVMVCPSNKGDFRPIILDYGLSYESAMNVQRNYIKDHGLRYKSKGKHYPALIRIYRISETLPENYFVENSLLRVKI